MIADNYDITHSSTAGYVVICQNDTSGWDYPSYVYCDYGWNALKFKEEDAPLIFAWLCFRYFEIEIKWPKSHLPESLPVGLYRNPILIRGPPSDRGLTD